MSLIDEHFKKYVEKISFIEIKENTYVDIKGYKIDNKTPLPIMVETLIEEIKRGEISEEIKVSQIIEGMIFIVGVDPDFKYLDEYKNILYNYDKNIEDYIFFKGLKKMESEKFEQAAILFRAIIVLNDKNVEALFNYGICLEEEAKIFSKQKNKKKKESFLLEAMKTFETILDISSKFSLAYYKLGYHYRNSGQYLKAKLAWEKFILLDKNEERIQEIREALAYIQDEVVYEEGMRLMNEGKCDDAINKFLNLKEKYSKQWNIYYALGLCYRNIGLFEEGIKHFKQALNLNPKEVDIYNEIGITLYGIEEFKNAVEIFTEGIKQNDMDYKIIFNRGLTYLQLGMYDKAKEDIDRAYYLNSKNKMINKQKKVLDDLHKNLDQQ